MTRTARPAGALLAAVLAGALASAGAAGGGAAPATGRVHIATFFKDGPPARVTGGFGEDSCFACHFDGTENDGKGALALSGLPRCFTPGETYRLELTLSRPGLSVAGFQLAVRHAGTGTQAGTLAVPREEAARVGILSERDVQFAQHELLGIEPADPGTGRWVVLWTAPDSGGRVLLHAAAVAGDGDDSQMGDHVYTLELASRTAQRNRCMRSR